MPSRPASPCLQPGCPVLSTSPRCAQHTRPAVVAYRGSSTQQGYGYGWRRLRAAVLLRDPLCTAVGCSAPSTDADHIVPRRQGGADSLDNLAGMCHRCHSSKTARSDGRWGRPAPAGGRGGRKVEGFRPRERSLGVACACKRGGPFFGGDGSR
jgi:5-methylcytosine-specific restriction protein A